MVEKSLITCVTPKILPCADGLFEPLSGRADAVKIFRHVLETVSPEAALRRYVRFDESSNVLMVAGRVYNLARYKRIVVVGGGKASRRTGSELVNVLGSRITAGTLNVYREQASDPIADSITLFSADHPTPNEAGVEGAGRMCELLKSADSETLVIALISGGGSSLMALPVAGISLGDYKYINKLLLTIPATIDEVNAVRKHIDPLKGGGMRKIAKDAGGFISLVLSDVPVTRTGVVDDPSVIASGPTVGDSSTFESAIRVLKRHKIWDQAPSAIKRYFQGNSGNEDNETLRQDSPLLTPDKSQYVIIANNDLAMEAAKDQAEQLGYTTHLIGCNTGSVAHKIKAEVHREIENIWKVISSYLIDHDRLTFASLSTDGVDGHSDLAGATAEEDTLATARGKGIDYKKYLAHYDSATFFKMLDLGITTGPTGTNVADVTIALIKNPIKADRKIAIVFGGEATVEVAVPEGREPGYGGRNTHLVLLAARKMDEHR